MKKSEVYRLKSEYDRMSFMFRLATSFYEYLVLKAENDVNDNLYPPRGY